jgi:hypothetical protein
VLENTEDGTSARGTASAASLIHSIILTRAFHLLSHSIHSEDESHFKKTIFAITQQTTSISFRYKVSSEERFDSLQFRIDDVLGAEWSGEAGWAQYPNTALSNSTHTFEWRYVKDESYSNGQGAAWVDTLEFSDDSNYAIWANSNSASADGTTDEDGNGIIDLT